MRTRFTDLIKRLFFHDLMIFAAIFSFVGVTQSGKTDRSHVETARTTWPHLIPCRIHEGANPDVFVMTLGSVKTSLADGMFDPAKDEVILNNGKVIKNYYSDSLGIKFYQPIDKKYFPLPPSGWCSWYYYYQNVNEKEIEKNARWVAENLKPYGAKYIQIDDGWQGKGHGAGDNRDWTTIDKRFPGGMNGLASYIKGLGLQPGLWLAPQGQSNPRVIGENPHAFLLNNDTSVSRTWEGEYLVDPSSKAGLEYLHSLFTTLSGWGFNYFKIDGQPIVIDEYHSKSKYMMHPSENADSLYRATVESIRSAIGEKRYLLGCWGIPLDGTGIMNGSRTGGDVVLGWEGFKTSLDATMHYYFLNNIVWYCDPDVMLLRYPLTLDQARAWATLQGLTGEALMTSDRMMDLSSDRVKILKSVFPAQDIRPLDLFPSTTYKHIWDLKINHLGENYDVVGLFNYSESKSKVILLKWSDLGYSDSTRMHIFDFWNKEYMGAWKGGIAVTLPPTSCRVLTLMKDHGHIRLISTNRHITQGYVDLVSLKLDSEKNTFNGKSKVVADAPYKLYFAFPPGKNYVVKRATAEGLKVSTENHQGWSEVKFTSPRTTEVNWVVSFALSRFYHYPVASPYGLDVSANGLQGVMLKWDDQYQLNDGCEVYLDGKLAGYTPTNVFPLDNLNPRQSYNVEIKSVWEDGTESRGAAKAAFEVRNLLPDTIYLSTLEPVALPSGLESVMVNKSISGKEISIGGKRYEFGIGVRADADIVYEVGGLYRNLSATVGVDDNSFDKSGTVEFSILGDGVRLWRSEKITPESGTIPVSIDIKGVKRLILQVKEVDGKGGNLGADWADIRLVGLLRK